MALIMAGGLLTVVAGCGEPRSAGTIRSEVFVETWVELRRAALSAEGQTLTDSVRAAVLEQVGVTEEELLTFAEVHGSDLQFMKTVWDSVAILFDSVRLGAPTDSPSSAPAGSGSAPPSSR